MLREQKLQRLALGGKLAAGGWWGQQQRVLEAGWVRSALCRAANMCAHLEQAVPAGGDHLGEVGGEVQAEDLRAQSRADFP